mgnify:CR=1 FL=1
MHTLTVLPATFMLLILMASPAQAEQFVYIDEPWLRATIPGTSISAGFMTIINDGVVAEHLVAVQADFAAQAELHTLSMLGEVMQMRPLSDGLVVPAGGSITLAPGGDHIMFMGLKQPLMAGDTQTVVLKFAGTGRLVTQVLVRQPMLNPATDTQEQGQH